MNASVPFGAYIPDVLCAQFKRRYDLLKLCNSGPIEQLNQTIYCQPAVMVTSLAALELLKKHQPNAIESCIGTAGFSLGELTALVFAGAIPFDAGVRLAQTRGKLMQAASDRHKGGMATIMTQSSSQLSLACKRGREWCVDYGAEEPDIVIANFLFSTCKVISGCTEGLRYIESNMDTYGLRRMLPVPAYGAFHSELMRSAVDPFAAALQKTWIEQPAIDVYSNVTGAKYDSPTQILKLLPKQMVRPVRWEQTMCILYDFKQHTSDYPATFVCGPGNALLNILKVINGQAWKHSTKIGA